MSNDEERYEVIFDWKIESFNNNDSLFVVGTPEFVSNLMGSTSWKLSLQALSPNDYFFYLRYVSINFAKIKIDCEISILDSNGSPIEKLENKNVCIFNKFSKLIKVFHVKDLFRLSKSQVVPQDILTVRCQMRQSSFKAQKLFQPEFHLCCTRIERGHFLWTTEDFFSFQLGHSSNMHLVYDQSKIKIITLQLLFDKFEHLGVQVIQAEDCKQICSFCLKISILDAMGKELLSKSNVCPVSSPLYLTTKDNLFDNKNVYLPMGVLTLQVEYIFSIEVTENNDENINRFSYRNLFLVRDTYSYKKKPNPVQCCLSVIRK